MVRGTQECGVRLMVVFGCFDLGLLLFFQVFSVLEIGIRNLAEKGSQMGLGRGKQDNLSLALPLLQFLYNSASIVDCGSKDSRTLDDLYAWFGSNVSMLLQVSEEPYDIERNSLHIRILPRSVVDQSYRNGGVIEEKIGPGYGHD